VTIKKQWISYTIRTAESKFIKGYDIKNPQDKIIMVFNRGAWQVKKDSHFCIQDNSKYAKCISPTFRNNYRW
jgi:hypothetical protein